MSARNHFEPFQFKVINTTDEYAIALVLVDELFNAKPGTPHGDELELLLLMVESYEKKTFPIDPPHPVEAIRFRTEQKGSK